MNMDENERELVNMIEIENATAVTPHNKALYEAGKSLMVDSISTGREFCNSMIGISTGAIPIYLGILAYLLPEDYTLGVAAGVVLAIPAIGFLVAAVVFIFGYLPVTGNFSLDIVEQVVAERDRIINLRQHFIIGGVIIFAISTFMAIIALIINFGAR